MYRIISSLAILLFAGVFSASAQTENKEVNAIGPYELGSSYMELKDLPGYTYDSLRSKPAIGIKAGKIIDRNVFDQATLQRLIFHKNRLVRVSIIIGSPSVTEEQTKALVAKQWGDPGAKQSSADGNIYIWKGSTGTIKILPADGGRQMITLTDNDKSHYVE